jgi:hypothetical protein
MIKQLITGSNQAPTSKGAKPYDGGIKVDKRLSLDDIINTAGTVATTVLTIPVAAESGFANAQVLNILPGFNGTITSINWHQGNVAATGAGAAATLTGQVATVATTGGVVTLATADAVGALKSGTAITGTNTFTKTQAIGVTVSAVTAFSAGTGAIELTVVNTDLLNSLTGNTLNTGTEPVYVIPAGTNPTVGLVNLPIPRDYDETSDRLALRVYIALANADASITITGTPTLIPLGKTAIAGTLASGTLEFQTTAANLSTTEQALDIDISGQGATRRSIVDVTLALVGTTTGNTYIYALEWIYASTIVSFNDTDSTGLDGSPLNEYGNELR